MISLPILLLWPAWHLKHPLLFAFRHVETPLLLGLPVLALIFHQRLPRLARPLFLTLFALTACGEVEYRQTRDAVLEAGPAVQAVGAHLVAGYTDLDELRPLAAKGLIGGIYLAKRNVRGRISTTIAADIAELQAIRRRAELPPLIVAADQEGGAVSHLSPLLEALPPLADFVSSRDPAADARAYGERQGRGLADLGVNLNFGPVVDLRPAGKPWPDPLSNIAARANASDPQRVAEIAGGYLDGLNAIGVRGTLKHFPGLGRVNTDTHLRPAHLAASADDLSADWQPFRQLAGHPAAAIMLGHVTLTALDAEHAASHSPAIVDGLLRQAWGYDGLLITDDLNMGAVYRKGIGRVAGEALAAGVDLVLVSYDPRQLYRALAGAAEALAEHRIAPARLAESDRRLADFVSQPALLAPSAMMQVHLSPVEPVSGHEPICYGQQGKTAKIEMYPAPSSPAQFAGMPARL
ncbi:MAG: glycoside hydrolase family 3 protein [Dechloromonas sp.]|uniref:beta-N-acetylhexosaminidase n=1 Tax=Candidatus Dechloromonas phosphorivorans TaxID=2899244 RepID=A0A935MRB9_9RHOO|nr:glycoside hydrolase family 3 protein [Candidatus Dechloromonas phosphorivorans]